MILRIRKKLIIALSLLLFGAGAPDTSFAQDIFQAENGVFSTSDLKLSTSVDARRKILIRATSNLRGRLSIKTADKAQASVIYAKQAKTDSRTRAFDYIDLMSVSLDRFPEYIRLDLRAPNPAPWSADRESGSIEAQLTIPAGCDVEIEALYFDVYAEGPFAALINRSSLGRLEITDVTKSLEITTSNRRVNLTKISGDISVTTSNATLYANQVTSPTRAARFRNDGGDIKIENLTGQVNVKNSYGRIDILGFLAFGEGNFIRGASGPIAIELQSLEKGQLVVSNRYEDIEIMMPSDISAFFSLAVDDDGIIDASNFTFTPTLVKPNRLAFSAGTGEVDVSASIRGKGNILITGIERDE